MSVGQLVISQYSHNFEQQEAISYFYFYCNKMGLHNNSDTKCKCDTLGDLVSFLQFQKSKNQPWRSVNSTKCDTPPWVFYMFFSLYKHHQIYHRAQWSQLHLKAIFANENLYYLIYFPPKNCFLKLLNQSNLNFKKYHGKASITIQGYR